jgi:hypothetical protein
MTWYTTDVTDDIIYMDGYHAFNFIAGETIYAGQAVYVSDTKTVKVTTSSANECDAIGIASINSTSERRIGVFTKGNIVRCCVDSSYNPSTLLYATDDGLLTSTKGNSKKVVGITLEQSTLGSSGVNYVCSVMLY